MVKLQSKPNSFTKLLIENLLKKRLSSGCPLISKKFKFSGKIDLRKKGRLNLFIYI